ncbi:MAG: hypothetical protein JWO36_2168 [Myxococcales bacterium]|nr:hypothetical protein [Myxococcales bacterium]
MASPKLTDLVATLAASSVELIVVGGLAAVAQGAPITPHDLDIVHRRTPENIERLLSVLTSVDARYRGDPPDKILRPTSEILAGTGHSLLATTFGPLDVLGAIEGGRDYDALLPRSIEALIGSRTVHVLSLEMIVELKRASSHPKDRRVLPELEETLRRSRGE